MTTVSQLLVDFHCHLDLLPDFEDQVAACETSRIATLAVTTTPRAWLRNRIVASKTKLVRPALGLHPQLAAERKGEIELFRRYLSETRYVGEVGIDGREPWVKSIAVQKELFKRILHMCCEDGNKIISIHSARASREVLNCVQPFAESSVKFVLHWFTGTAREASDAARMNAYFSINPKMITTRSGREIISSLPSNRILTETDCPFVVGASSRREILQKTIDGVAQLRGSDSLSTSALIRKNLIELLGYEEFMSDGGQTGGSPVPAMSLK